MHHMNHKYGTSVVHKWGLTRFWDSLCIIHLMYVYSCIADAPIDPKEDKRQDIEGIENSNSVDIFIQKVPKT